VTDPPATDPLEQLAAARGVAVGYTDAFGARHRTSPDTLVAILAALGEQVERPGDARQCLARRRVAAAQPPPVLVAWDGHLDDATLGAFWDTCVPSSTKSAQGRQAGGRELRLELEDGSTADSLVAAPSPADQPVPIPYGVHKLHARSISALVISAPIRTRAAEPGSWGVFAPTYALVDERRSGMGDLTCLERLGTLAGGLGGSYVSTLPLLADYSTADDGDAVTSPYSPLSRMWWNEAYLDVSRIPGLDHNAGAPQASVGGLEEVPAHADIARAGADVLASLARLAWPRSGPSRETLDRFLSDRPDVKRYAAFRAATQTRGTHQAAWPERWRAGDITAGRDVPESLVQLHVLAQWLTDTQIAEVAASTSARGCRLMLDLPIGCRPDGYDTWAFPSSFAGHASDLHAGRGISVGAPPDRFFGDGQDWGFRPLDPEGERRAGYPVVRGALSHLLAHAGALRIDHILGLQRLWWIPAGARPSEGAYVAYPFDELVALACLEAWRRDAVLIGEDLGTVDPSVRRLMAEHGIAGMEVGVFDLDARPGQKLDPPAGACALVDTHDTATFAGWLDGTDIGQRLELGLLDSETAARARVARSAATRALVRRLTGVGDAVAVHAAVLEELGGSDAGVVIATLEDLWAEHEPQNIPGTSAEHTNFARQMRVSLDAIETDEHLLEPLRRLDRARAGRRTPFQTTLTHDTIDHGEGTGTSERACAPEDQGRVAS
jgi:4-alpha-glucanotransferase